jgi:hypothetical protein
MPFGVLLLAFGCFPVLPVRFGVLFVCFSGAFLCFGGLFVRFLGGFWVLFRVLVGMPVDAF